MIGNAVLSYLGVKVDKLNLIQVSRPSLCSDIGNICLKISVHILSFLRLCARPFWRGGSLNGVIDPWA